jgi:hypothetical protein
MDGIWTSSGYHLKDLIEESLQAQVIETANAMNRGVVR